MKTVLLISNTAWSFYKFRKGLITALVNQGLKVILVAPSDEFQQLLEALGTKFIPLKTLEGKSKNAFKDIAFVRELFEIYRSVTPHLIIQYTIKPNIYSSYVANRLKIPTIGVVTGLGYTFINKNIVSAISRRLYRMAFRLVGEVWFLNEEDREVFYRYRLVNPAKTHVINGEGVNCAEFDPGLFLSSIPAGQPLRFVLPARLLYDKGVLEYVEAAREIKMRYPDVEFNLLGFLNVNNPSAVSAATMQEWVDEGVVNYLGSKDDVRTTLISHHCVVLPSYREGMSMVLMESAALERPIIASNIPGCKQIVEDGKTGFLCRPKDKADLARQMEKFILLDQETRINMGRQARKKMMNEFSEQIIISGYMERIFELL
ncbi:MAG TPA: glycosyltransferase family 4 protein [Chitinophaga sp.]|uniref:glycosyltransferase family 4 protein n=1 Tax=Chitinophaga sp. TaxID=1869181 RepID=UPI002BD94728|nr:glycosyltransferase family 4 protein [Chitinophaga sp.]HVI45454.1 glycosyltransferase family 4 protein [Chitinophaga sp.]